jgi:molecular chaperone DnaK (HSP70)
MAELINIGLDFGSVGWRAAYVAGEEVVPVPLSGWENPAQWLMCEPAPTSVLGVHFPSLKSRLGMESLQSGNMGINAAATVQERFDILRRLVVEQTKQPIGQLVLAVPALYSASRRATLRDLALTVGFSDVHLLNDAMAAVIGHTQRRQESCTVLVYSTGYSGFEVGLLRVARGRYRAIAYDGASAPGGVVFDTLIMRGYLQALATQRLWSPAHSMSSEDWFRLRAMAQHCKELLATEELVELPLNITTRALQQGVRLSLSREDFAQAIADTVAQSLATTERLLDDANLRHPFPSPYRDSV